MHRPPPHPLLTVLALALGACVDLQGFVPATHGPERVVELGFRLGVEAEVAPGEPLVRTRDYVTVRRELPDAVAGADFTVRGGQIVIRVTGGRAYPIVGVRRSGSEPVWVVQVDETYALPTQESVTLALRTQQLIAHESGADRVVDPLGGSYYVEYLTGEMEKLAQDYIRKIDDMGGIIRAVEEARGPYKVSVVAEAAALRALEDDAAVRRVVEQTLRTRERLRSALAGLGLPALPSEANFLCVPLAPAVGPARVLAARLLERGVAVRAVTDEFCGFEALRITVGPWPLLERLLAALDAVLAEVRSCR